MKALLNSLATMFWRDLCEFNTVMVYSITWGWKQCLRHKEIGAAKFSTIRRYASWGEKKLSTADKSCPSREGHVQFKSSVK